VSIPKLCPLVIPFSSRFIVSLSIRGLGAFALETNFFVLFFFTHNTQPLRVLAYSYPFPPPEIFKKECKKVTLFGATKPLLVQTTDDRRLCEPFFPPLHQLWINKLDRFVAKGSSWEKCLKTFKPANYWA
jgi:hypothetical protein